MSEREGRELCAYACVGRGIGLMRSETKAFGKLVCIDCAMLWRDKGILE